MSRRARHEWILSGARINQPQTTKRRSARGTFSLRRRLRVERLEERCLLAVAPLHLSAGLNESAAPNDDEVYARVDVPQGVFTAAEIAAFGAIAADSSLSSKTPPGAQQDGGHGGPVLTFVLDFKEAGQGSTFDLFGNEVTVFDIASYGFSAGDFNTLANAILAEVDEDYFTELVGTVAGPPGQDLEVDFVIGNIGTAPAGVSEYYYVQIGTGVAGPHSGGTLGVAGGSVVRNSAGSGPNGSVDIGDVVASVFTDAIGSLGGLTPSNALTSGNLVYTTYAVSGTLSHEIGHTLSLSHINKAGSVQPTSGRPPLMGTGAIDLPSQDRIGDREFSLSGFDGENGNAPRQHIQQLVGSVGLHNSTVPGIDLAGTGFNVSPTNLLVAGGVASASFTVRNGGATAAGAFDVKFYLSDDNTIDPGSDILLTLDPADPSYDGGEPSAFHVDGGLASAGILSDSVALAVPASDPFATDNDYYLGMYVDADGNVTEVDETNNRNLGQGIDRDNVNYSDNVASFPFFEDWEAGPGFDPWWEVVLGTEGRVEITSANGPYQGAYHVTLDDTVAGSANSLNQLILHINLAGQSGIRLQFANKEFSDEDHPEDSVSVSVDGGSTWHQVVALTGANSTATYTERSYDLDGLGLSYSADTLIRFQQYDNFPIASGPDGMAFDNIRVNLVPGTVDHFGIDPISDPQEINDPFPVTINAIDALGGAATSFNGTVNLSGWVDSGTSSSIVITEINEDTPDYVEIQNVSGGAVDTTGWVVAVNDAVASNINDMHSVLWSLPSSIAPGEVLYRTDDTVDNYWGSNIFWGSGTQRGWAMVVDDGGNVVDFQVWGYSAAEIASLNVTIGGHSIAIGSEWAGAGVAYGGSPTLSLQRIGNADGDSAADFLWVARSKGVQNSGLTVPFSGGATQVSISPNASGNFVNGVWTGFVTVNEVAEDMYLRADDGSGHTGASNTFDVVAPIPGSIQGQKWNDLDGDGIKEDGEPGLEGWTIYLDENGNGVFDSEVLTAVSTDVPLTAQNSTVFSELTVTGALAVIQDINVTLDISHTWDTDAQVYLIGPSGTRVELFTNVGGSSDNFTNTTLDDEAATPITGGVAPFTGSFRPEGLLADFDGEDPNGEWKLEFTDIVTADSGTLNSWSLSITASETFDTTDASGNYSFTDLAPGEYFVAEVQQPGWQQTYPTIAGGTLYFSADSNSTGLYSIDPVSSAATLIGASGVSASTVGLASSGSNDVLYGSKPFGLQIIQTDGSGAVTLGSAGFEGMAFDPTTETLYGAINGQFMTINTATGGILQNLPSPGADVEGLEYVNGFIYGLVCLGGGGGTPGHLLRYNIAAATWSLVGNTGLGSIDDGGLAYDPGRDLLYAKVVGNSNLYSIDPDTAATTVIGSTGLTSGGGLAFVGGGGQPVSHTVVVGAGVNVMNVDFGNHVVLLLGDYNRDDSVDAGDYVVWRKTLGTTGLPAYSGADGDGDGTIGTGDLAVWKSHFGETVGAGSGGQVGSVAGGGAGDDQVESGKGEVGSEGQSATLLTASDAIGPFELQHPYDEDYIDASNQSGSAALPNTGFGSGGNQGGSGSVASWVFQGGAPIAGGQTEPNTQPNKQVTGAVHAVLADPTNADILYIGAVNGGIWKTTNATTTNPVWVPQTDFQQSLSTGAMSFDRTDATYNTLVAGIGNWSSFGSAGGARTGVLRTTDGGTTWSNLGSVGLVGKNLSGIAGQGSTIVASSSSSGLMRSTDGGATFAAITSSDFTSSNRFLDLVEDLSDPTGQRLYTSCEDKGIYRSDDFGATWVKITGTAINAEMEALLTNTSNNNTEMTVHPTTGRLYVAVLISGQARGIFYTNDGTAGSPTWTRMDVPVVPQSSGAAITGVSGLGVSPITITATNHGLSTGHSVVINGVTGNTAANGLFWVTNIDANTFSLTGTTGNGNWTGGGTWTKVTSPNPTVKDIDSEAGSQGSIHFSILVDPTDENILYVGGDRQDTNSLGGWPNSIGANDYSGAIFRGDTRLAPNPNVAPSPQWDHMTADVVAIDPSGGTANGTGPHADSREMAYAADGRLIEVDDGGIFARTSPRNNTGNWFSMASNLGTVEYHSIAYDTNSNVIIGGTQDNGTQVQRTFGNTAWDALSTADGGAVAVDTISQAALQRSVRYSSFQNLGSFRRTVFNASNGLVSTAFPALTVTSGAAMSKQFYTPVAVNNIDGTRLLLGASNGVYESFSQGDTVAAAGTNAIAVGSRGNAIDYGGRSGGVDNEEVAYVAGGSGGVYVRTMAGGPFVATIPAGAGSILSVKMDPDEWQTAFAMDSSRVFMTTNAGGSWTNITGDVASVGATGFLSLEYVGGVVDAVLLGTNLGVYATLLSSAGTWVKLGSGLPNAPAWDLDYDAADDVLVAGTLGRGAWSLSDASIELRGPGVALTETGGATLIVEAGATDTYDLALITNPTGPVEITVTADSQSEVSLDGLNFAPFQVFTRSDTSAQTITVRAIDDGLIEGLHTSTISHAITGTVVDPDYPLSLAISSIVANVADNELAPFERVAPLGGLISVSDANSGSLAGAASHADFNFVVDGGQIIAASVDPVANVLLSVELVGVSGVFTAAAAGAPVALPATALTSDGTYTLRVTADGATDFDLSAMLNTVVEVGDASDGNELAIDDSFIALGSGRYGVVGESVPPASSGLQFTKTNNPSQFVDISATGTLLNLSDDAAANITTTVGNSIFPAGITTVANNGGILVGGGLNLSTVNTVLPSASFGKALLAFWDDIDADTGGVYWQELQVGGIDTLIVQWENRPHYSNVGSATFQLQLFESGPVLARFAYEDVVFGSALYDFGAGATIGYQASTSSALQYSFNTASIADGDVLDLASPTTPDIDEYEIDLTGKAGQPIDIVLAGIGADFADQTLELLTPDGSTVLATAVTDPIQSGIDATNYDLGILDFGVPADGVYTLRLTSNVAGQYSLVVTDPLSFDTEPNDNAALDPLRDISDTKAALGHLDAAGDQDDWYEIQLAQGQSLTVSTQTPFDSSSSTPLNDLDPELQVIHPDLSTVMGTDSDSADGKNAELTFSAPDAGTYRIRVRATSGAGEYLLHVEDAVALPGDYNRDDVVDAADYVVWRKTLGTTVSPYSGADGDGDGTVDSDDLAVWKANFGNTLPPNGAGSGGQGAGSGAQVGSADGSGGSVEQGANAFRIADFGLRIEEATNIHEAPTVSPAAQSVAPVAATAAEQPLNDAQAVRETRAQLAETGTRRGRRVIAQTDPNAPQRDNALVAWLASRVRDVRADDKGDFKSLREDGGEPADSRFEAVDAVFERIAVRRGLRVAWR